MSRKKPPEPVNLPLQACRNAVEMARERGAVAVRLEWQPTDSGANYAVAISDGQLLACWVGDTPLIDCNPDGCLAAVNPGLRPLERADSSLTVLQFALLTAEALLDEWGEVIPRVDIAPPSSVRRICGPLPA